MISETTKRILLFHVNCSQYWFATPFIWDKSQDQLNVTRKSFRNWLLTLGLCFIYTVYLITRLVIRLVFGVPKMSLFEMSELYFAGISWIAISLNHANTFFKYEELTVMVNSFKLFSYNMQEIYVPKWNRRWRNGCEELLKIDIFVAIIVSIGSLLHCLGNPAVPIFFTSLLVDYKLLFWVAYLPMGFLTLYMHLAGALAMTLSVAFPMIPAAILNSIIQEFKPKLRNHMYRTKNTFRKVENLSKTYRCYHIIEKLTNEGYRNLVMPLQLVLSYCSIIANFALIRFWDNLPWSTRMVLVGSSIGISLIWAIVLLIAGTMVKKSTGLINYWKRSEWSTPSDRKYMKKFSKSCQYLKMEFGGFYHVSVTKVLIFINFVIWGTTRTLMILEQ